MSGRGNRRGNRRGNSRSGSRSSRGRGGGRGGSTPPAPAAGDQRDFYEDLAVQTGTDVRDIRERVQRMLPSYEGHREGCRFIDHYLEAGVTELRPMDLNHIGNNGVLPDGTNYRTKLEAVASANDKYQKAEAKLKDLRKDYRDLGELSESQEKALKKAERALKKAEDGLEELSEKHDKAKAGFAFLRNSYNKWRKVRRMSPEQLREAMVSGDALYELVTSTGYRPGGVQGPMMTFATQELCNMMAVLRIHDAASSEARELTQGLDAVLARYSPGTGRGRS